MSVQKQEKEQKEKAKGVVNCSTPDTSDSECCSDQDLDTAVPAAALPRVPQSDNRDDDDDDHHHHKDEEDDEDDIPEEFICPLTLELFNVPLMDRRGVNFERKAIVEWLNRGHRTCPLTREPLTYRSFVPNVNLKARVDHWKRMHGYHVRPYSSNYDDAEEDNEEEEVEQKYFMIQAPPRSSMELRWEQAYQRAVREEILRNVLNRSSSSSNTDNGNGPGDGSARRRRRHRRRRNHHSQHSSNNNTAATDTIASPTGVSPATQRRRLAGMIGEALNIVRRPPLATSDH